VTSSRSGFRHAGKSPFLVARTGVAEKTIVAAEARAAQEAAKTETAAFAALAERLPGGRAR
jgi:hypothetical protein